MYTFFFIFIFPFSTHSLAGWTEKEDTQVNPPPYLTFPTAVLSADGNRTFSIVSVLLWCVLHRPPSRKAIYLDCTMKNLASVRKFSNLCRCNIRIYKRFMYAKTKGLVFFFFFWKLSPLVVFWTEFVSACNVCLIPSAWSDFLVFCFV